MPRVIAVTAQIRSIGQGGRPLFEKQLIHTVAARSLATQGDPGARRLQWCLEIDWKLGDFMHLRISGDDDTQRDQRNQAHTGKRFRG